jgi:hypothetical protein
MQDGIPMSLSVLIAVVIAAVLLSTAILVGMLLMAVL